MTMNPHTDAGSLRRESRQANLTRNALSSAPTSNNAGAQRSTIGNAASSAAAADSHASRASLTPAALASAAFILAVTLIAKVFYK